VKQHCSYWIVELYMKLFMFIKSINRIITARIAVSDKKAYIFSSKRFLTSFYCCSLVIIAVEACLGSNKSNYYRLNL
jgi:hypothetical protein